MKILARLSLIALSFAYICPARHSAANSLPDDRWLNGAPGYARALQLQRELNVPLVVYFYADWCPYCHTLEGHYFPAAEVQDYLRQVVKVRINPEHGSAERELAASYGVRGYPSFFIIRRPTSSPVKVHPFTQSGNLTAAQFARACRNAAPVTPAVLDVSGSGRGTRPQINTTGNAQVMTKQERPQGLQIMTLKPAAAPAPVFLSGGRLPTADQVLAKYTEAIGGRTAQMRLNNRMIKGRVDIPGVSNGGRLEIHALAPNKLVTEIDIETIGNMRQGFDGRAEWKQTTDSGGHGSIEQAVFAFARDVESYSVLSTKQPYARLKLLGKVKEGFRECYLVEATPRVGGSEQLYFDADSGLLVRRDVTRLTSQGRVRAETYLNDWREVDGVKFPFRMTQTMPGITFVITLNEVKHNLPVDEAIFRRPSR